MKASVSNRIYMKAEKGSDLELKIRKELTHELPPQGGSADFLPLIVCTMQRVSDSIISFPKGRMDLIPEGYEIIDRRVYVPVEFPKFKFQLREDQESLYNSVNDSGIIIANPSFGKTFTSLAIAAKLKQKTLIIVHTTTLREQWIKEIKKCFGVDAGVIGGGVEKVGDIFTVANIQSLRTRVQDYNSEFGLVIVDEAHHAAAKSFEKTINHFKSRYMLALTATINRKDGRHVLLKDYFSKNEHVTEKAGQMTPIIHSYESPVTLSDNMMIPWAEKVNAVYADARYYEQCLGIMRAYIELGRTILFVSDRVELLARLAMDTTQPYITSEVSIEDRERLKEALQNKEIQALYGTYSIFSEGVNIPSIDCLVIGMAINNDSLLEQLVGRAIREQEGKVQPIIADIALRGTTARKQRNSRFAFYSEQGYEVKKIF